MAIAPTTSSKTIEAPNQAPARGALAIVTSLFFMWGFLTCLNDILIPHLKAVFDLNYTKTMLINSAWFGAYFIFGIPSGMLIERIGYKRSMVTGLITMGVGALLFVPAANILSYPLFLTALLVLATGVTLLQTAANPYVAVLGPSQTASSRLVLTQAFNSLGTFLAPFFGSMLILSKRSGEELARIQQADPQAFKLSEAASVKVPYVGLALALFAVGIMMALVHLPKLSVEKGTEGAKNDSVWRHRQLVLGAIGIFVYVGAEVSIGSFLVNYFSQPEIANLPAPVAARYVAVYWGCAMVGRFIGSALLQKIPAGKLLAVFAGIAAALVCTSMLTSGAVAMYSILAVGLFNSIMFPAIFTLAIDGLGGLTGEGSGVLVSAIVGGAIIPVVQGALADNPSIGIHHAFFLPVVCYLYILYFGVSGSKHGAPAELEAAPTRA